jgi:DNA-binding NarL/FixJ family response regulator
LSRTLRLLGTMHGDDGLERLREAVAVADGSPARLEFAKALSDPPFAREIAQTLYVTPKTVEVHLTSIYRKLGISRRAELSGTAV